MPRVYKAFQLVQLFLERVKLVVQVVVTFIICTDPFFQSVFHPIDAPAQSVNQPVQSPEEKPEHCRHTHNKPGNYADEQLGGYVIHSISFHGLMLHANIAV
jgi:hypothetical protein